MHGKLVSTLLREKQRLGLCDSKLILVLNLLDHDYHARGKCWPSVRRLAGRMGKSPRRVRQLLQELEETVGGPRLVRRILRPNASNVYDLAGLYEVLAKLRAAREALEESPPGNGLPGEQACSGGKEVSSQGARNLCSAEAVEQEAVEVETVGEQPVLMEQDRTSENSPDAEARNAAAPNGTARPLDENPFVEGSEYWSWFQPLMEIWQEFREGAPHGVSTDAAGRFMKLVDHSGKGSSAKMAGVLRQGLEQDETHTIRCLSYFIPRFADEVGVSLV